MELQPEQKKIVAQWVAAGDNLSAIQKKLADELKLSMTYMEVRFLVDDLNLELKDPAPAKAPKDIEAKNDASAETPSNEKKGFLDKMKEKVGLGSKQEKNQEEAPFDEEAEEYDELVEEEAAAASGAVNVVVDEVTLIPGAVASGSVTFSDGVTGKWIVDQYGRPGFTEISQPGYRPSAADAQGFMQELGRALRSRGF